MNKLDTNPIAQTYVVQPAAHTACGHRLIVLVSPDIDYAAATPRIWELANATGMHIRLLGLYEDAADESSLRRELVTMASLLRDGRIAAEATVAAGTSWLEAAKSNYETGDMIVCFAEQRSGIWRRPLSQILESNFKGTVYILSGLMPHTEKTNRLSQLLAWVGCLIIIIGFGILQTRLVQLSEGWFQSTWLVLSILPEFLLIWFWNGLFG